MEADAVVLDIDGVLVDTSESYDRAIVETVATVYGKTIEREAIQWFKNAGGFNNDWFVTEAAALYILARDRGYAADLREFTDRIAERGGGPAAVEEVLVASLGEERFEAARKEWDPDRLRRTFQWLYLGPSRYEKYEDEPAPPDRPQEAGFIDRETILLDESTRDWLQGWERLGVLTGRPSAEALIALERAGVDVPREHLMSMDDWNGGKPDPAGLLTLGKRLDAVAVAYAGDELDDVRTAVNANEADTDRTYHGIGVQSGGLTGKAGKRRLLDVGAVATLESINELPEVVRKRA